MNLFKFFKSKKRTTNTESATIDAEAFYQLGELRKEKKLSFDELKSLASQESAFLGVSLLEAYGYLDSGLYRQTRNNINHTLRTLTSVLEDVTILDELK